LQNLSDGAGGRESQMEEVKEQHEASLEPLPQMDDPPAENREESKTPEAEEMPHGET